MDPRGSMGNLKGIELSLDQTDTFAPVSEISRRVLNLFFGGLLLVVVGSQVALYFAHLEIQEHSCAEFREDFTNQCKDTRAVR